MRTLGCWFKGHRTYIFVELGVSKQIRSKLFQVMEFLRTQTIGLCFISHQKFYSKMFEARGAPRPEATYRVLAESPPPPPRPTAARTSRPCPGIAYTVKVKNREEPDSSAITVRETTKFDILLNGFQLTTNCLAIPPIVFTKDSLCYYVTESLKATVFAEVRVGVSELITKGETPSNLREILNQLRRISCN